MFGWKKGGNPRRTEGGKALMAQMGFVTDVNDMVLGSPSDDEDDLEAELRALQCEGLDDSSSKSKKKGKLKNPAELDKMIAASMKDVPSDDDVSDTEDPELMAELEGLMSDDDDAGSSEQSQNVRPAPIARPDLSKLLQDRIANYNAAVANAEASEDSFKVRRYARGLKTLEDMMNQVKMNRSVEESDIPPPVAITTKPPQPRTEDSPQPKIQPTSSVASTEKVKAPRLDAPASEKDFSDRVRSSPQPLPRTFVAEAKSPSKETAPANDRLVPSLGQSPRGSEKLSTLTNQRELYKAEALKMKRSGNSEKAVELMRAFKQLDAAVEALGRGQTVDENALPPFLTSKLPTPEPGACRLEAPCQSRSDDANFSPPKPSEVREAPKPAGGAPGSLLDDLMLRMTKYKEAEVQARNESNSGKERRMARIVKQYEDAIKMHKKGQPYDYSELPSPPGFSPLGGSAPPPPKETSPPSQPNMSPQKAKGPVVQRQTSVLHSRAEQQATFLVQRQLQFKKAAIQAKATGDLELAKKYMRMAKGFDQMIEAARSGLPVDLAQIPSPPGEESDFVFVQAFDVPVELSGNAKEVYTRLQDDLINQIKVSETNRDMFTKLGDISSANKFDKLRVSSMRDLESLKNAFEHGDPVPRFHYETRQFSIVRCCPDLGDNDLEISVIRGLNFNPPSGYSASDMHTYVKYEFPLPDAPQTGETSVVKGTDSPEFNFIAKLEVNRKSRSFLRILKSSKTLKFDIFYRRGFLKGDKMLGSVAIKLQPLEDACVIHDSYSLMDGRKAVGGKLEVKIRTRDPFVNKQVDETKEKWLVIDDFVRKSPEAGLKLPQSKGTPPSPRTSGGCLSVLMYEKDALEQQVAKYQSRLKPTEISSLKQKSALLQSNIQHLRTQLQTGGTKGLQEYLIRLKTLSQAYAAEAKAQASSNAPEKVKVALTKKTLVDKEIESMSRKLQAK